MKKHHLSDVSGLLRGTGLLESGEVLDIGGRVALAYDYLYKGNLVAAHQIFTNFPSSSSTVALGLAYGYFKAGKFLEVSVQLHKIESDGETMLEACYLDIFACIRRGDIDGARSIFKSLQSGLVNPLFNDLQEATDRAACLKHFARVAGYAGILGQQLVSTLGDELGQFLYHIIVPPSPVAGSRDILRVFSREPNTILREFAVALIVMLGNHWLLPIINGGHDSLAA